MSDTLHRPDAAESAIVAALAQRSIVLIGMMGAGKSRWTPAGDAAGIPFVDADAKIEEAAQMTIPKFSRPMAKPSSARPRRA